MIVLASALQDGERIIPVRAELKLYDNRPTALYFAIAESTVEESRNAAHKKEPDRQVRQEPLLAQEAALPSSSELTITEFYQLVKADPDFTKYFSDDIVRKAEGLDRMRKEEAELHHRPCRARSLRRGRLLCPGRLVLFHSVGNAAAL